MTRRRTTALVLALVTALAGCTSGEPESGGSVKESDGVFDPAETQPSLPPIATADCPGPAELLTEAEAEDAPGDRLPDLTLDCIGSRRSVSLRAVGGIPTVLNLWASWCLPCKKEMPAFQRVFTAAGGRVRFLGINVADNERNARSAIQATGISYASVRSAERTMLNAMRVPGPPMTLFVDAQGTLVHREVGELTDTELLERIAEHLGVDIPAGP